MAHVADVRRRIESLQRRLYPRALPWRLVVPSLLAASVISALIGGFAITRAEPAQRSGRGSVRDDAAVRAANASSDPAETRSPLVVLRDGAGPAARPTVFLGKSTGTEDERAIKGTAQGILMREVIRQAVLIAARDELGASTRDEVLGELLTEAVTPPAVEVVSIFREGGKSRAAIRRLADNEGAPLVDEPLAAVAIPKLVEKAEHFSRTGFLGALKTLGLSGRANVLKHDAEVPAGVDDALGGLSYSSLFSAVRSLHDAIRTDGESPARLAALARAYALLGVLTEFHWHPAHKVFKARALLYAQRLVARDPSQPFALWNRAYVRALAGMNAGARTDLTQAQQKVLSLPAPVAKSPDWVPVIDAYLRYDTRKLSAQRGPQQGLAALLQLLAIEFPWSRSQTIPVAKRILARDSDCFRAIDAICQAGGLGDLHVATALGPKMLDDVVPKNLKRLPNLPAPVGAAIDRGADGPALVDGLRRAGAIGQDTGEPSWTTLGQLLAESRFVHVWRRLTFLRNKLAVPVDDFWNEAQRGVAGHRFRPYLESLTLAAPQAIAVRAQFLATLDVNDLEVKEVNMTHDLKSVDSPRASIPWKLSVVHVDNVAHDLAETIQATGNSIDYARRLLSLSPRSPYGRAVRIEKDWNGVKANVAAWEDDPITGDAPTLLAALGKRYSAMGRIDDAQRALKRYLKDSPEYWAYRLMADNERDRGDLKRWKEALDEFLSRGEDSGLDFAGAQVEIARRLMELGQWSKALPYAESAAQTGAGWAMDCAGGCNEGLGNYERAESWFRAESERYARSFMEWFNFCKRTGHGDVKAAGRLALAFVKQDPGALSENEKALAILVFDLAGEPAQGVAFVRPLVTTTSPLPGVAGGRLERWVELMFLAEFADALNDKALRDQSWADIEKSDHQSAVATAAMFRQALDAKQSKPFDRSEFAALMDTTDAKARSYLMYFAGHFEDRHGKVEEAVKLWERCAAGVPGGGSFVALLGTNALRTRLRGEIPADSQLHYLRGYYHRAEDRLPEALRDLDESLRLDPKNRSALNLRGVVKRASGDLDGSAADFGILIGLAPDEPAGFTGRAITRIFQARDAEASADIERALAVRPKSAFGQVAQGLLLEAQGKREEAQQRFDEALTRDPSVGTPLEQLKRDVARTRRVKVPE
jgi:tetratricopeptide (TPR) repeat protein